jgi:hypothetical protein
VVEDVTRPEERRYDFESSVSRDYDTHAHASGRSDDDDPLQAKTNEVTDALRRTVGTMKAELERSVQVTQMFGMLTKQFLSGVAYI